MSEIKDYVKTLGKIPSGLFIVSVESSENVVDGYLASWVQQVSFNPMVVALAIKSDRPGYSAIKEGKPFAINIVSEKSTQVMRHFWSGYDDETNPFKNEVKWERGEKGGALIKESLGGLECVYKESVNPGDHEIVFAEVVGGALHEDEGKPKVHIRKSGLDY